MDENIFWLWNGWGVLFLVGVALWQFLHIAVTIFVRGLSSFRPLLIFFLALPSIVLGFVFAGWAVGVLNIILGMIIGTAIARMIVIARESS